MALQYARALSQHITAIYVSSDEESDRRVMERWKEWAPGVPLVVIDSPYREWMFPLVSYVEQAVAKNKPDEVLTVVVPEFVPKRWRHHLLHMQNATWLRWALRHVSGVVVVDVPYQVEG